MQEVKDKEEGSATKPKRRRVQFRGSPFQKTKPSLVLTSVDAKYAELNEAVNMLLLCTAY